MKINVFHIIYFYDLFVLYTYCTIHDRLTNVNRNSNVSSDDAIDPYIRYNDANRFKVLSLIHEMVFRQIDYRIELS